MKEFSLRSVFSGSQYQVSTLTGWLLVGLAVC